MAEQGGSTFFWTVALGAAAVGSVYWVLSRQRSVGVMDAHPSVEPSPAPVPAPLSLQVAAPSGDGQTAALSDGSSPMWPDPSAPWTTLVEPVQGAQQGLAAADRFATAPLYEYDPWHPEAYVLSAEGIKALSSAPLNGYLIDHEGAGAVYHTMSDPAVSSAKNDAFRYNGSNTIRATAEAGKVVYLGKQDLDDLQFGKLPQTLVFATTVDAAGWLASPNEKRISLRSEV